jgi:phenylacetate-CoA ligase
LTTKEQLVNGAAVAVAPADVAEWVCTSGTAGAPLDVPLTAADLRRLAANEAAALGIAGVGPGDVVLLAVGMDRLFVAGLAYWLGARERGATCVRVGPQLAVQHQLLPQLLDRFARGGTHGRPRVFLIAVPSFLAAADAAALRPGAIDGVIAIGEPIRAADDDPAAYNVLGSRLHAALGCPVMSTYASTETCTTFAEGPRCAGGHLNPELAVVEIVDDAGRPVAPSAGHTAAGEVVVTPLGVEGMPLLRFRTGDVAALYTAPCPCGRTTPRLGPIIGRRHQLLKVRGTSIYPNAIVDALRALPEVADCAVVAEEEHPLSDRLTVFVEAQAAHASAFETTRRRVEGQLRGLLRVTPEVRYVGGEELRRLQQAAGSRKATRFIDRRPRQGP